MQRDIGSEVIVAIVAVGALVFAFAFGTIITLSGSTGNAPTPVSTSTTESIAQAPSDTPSPTTARTATVEAATDTRVPTSTATDVPTATEAPVTESATETETPIVTLTDASTAIPTTVAPTSTPTATATDEPTRIAQALNTPLATQVCIAPFGWQVYRVQFNDTLARIASASGITIEELRNANCLRDFREPDIGASLYVPHLPLYVGGAPAYSPQGCSDSHVQIVSPVSGQRIQGLFRLFGTADGTNFSAYQIEVRPDFASSYDLYAEFNEPVRNGDLGEVDTRAYGRGLHWVRVRVTTQDGSNPVPCAIPVIFD